ncbi:hypothetical protein ACO0R3_002557 [Hanseniaspora guilliermondii]
MPDKNSFDLTTKVLDCDGAAYIMVQYPSILDELRTSDEIINKSIRNPITCVISKAKIKKLEKQDNQPFSTTDEISSIYYLTPNPKRIGGTDYIETTILEENEKYKHFASRINMLLYKQVGLKKTPVFLYLTNKLAASIDNDVDIYQILSVIKNSF